MSGQPLWGDRRAVLLLGSSYLSGNFFSEVVDWLLDAFANLEVGEGNDFSTGFLGQLANFDFRVHDESLLFQRGFGLELGDTTVDHVLNDVFRLASDLVGVQLQEDVLLALDGFGGDFRRIQELRVRSGNVHGDVLGQLDVATFQNNGSADLVAVQVGTDNVTLNAHQATDVDVLAALGDQGFTSCFTRGNQGAASVSF